MLQQTRVDQAIPYFHRFTEQFPDVQSLAQAERQDVLKAWEGLGYYSRARNMQDAARSVVNNLNGRFPDTPENIRALKGIGPYTSAAIASIAFGHPAAVVDGNVIRVISRLFGIGEDVSTTRVKKEIQELADELIDSGRPGDYNQAVMELGATVCTPSNPDCLECPVSLHCTAFNTAQTESIPYKAPKKKVPHHQIVVGICRNESGRLLIALRPEDKMLGGLWEFPGGKVEPGEQHKQALERELKEELGVETVTGAKLTEIKHAYSHFKITLHAYLSSITKGEPKAKASRELRWIRPDELQDYPFPRANRKLTEILQTYLASL